MKNFKLLVLLTFIPCLFFATESQTLRYENAIGKAKEIITWKITTEKDKILFSGENKQGFTSLEYTPEYQLTKYTYQEKQSPPPSYTIERKNPSLVSRTKRAEKDLIKEFGLNGRLWIQHFGSGLKPFVLSDRESIEFWIFDVKRQNWNKLIAKKQNVRPLTVEGKNYQAQQVKISLGGFYSMFWNAKLWFDTKDATLLMETSNEGPKTPTYFMKLLSKE